MAISKSNRRSLWSVSVLDAAARPSCCLVAGRIARAGTFGSRLFGLLGRRDLEAGGGLWLVGTNGVHTIGMRFAIDVAFLDPHQRILAIYHRLAPGKIAPAVPGATSCLELAAGTAARHGLEVGERLHFTANL